MAENRPKHDIVTEVVEKVLETFAEKEEDKFGNL